MLECYNKIISPSEIVDYSNLVISQYERRSPGILHSHPFVGLKLLLKDLDAYRGTGRERISYLESCIGKILPGTGCFLRETNNNLMPDGFWLVTLPVPLYQLNDRNVNQLGRMLGVLSVLERDFNIVFQGRIEINVSGRCAVVDTERRLSAIYIPNHLMQFHSRPENSAYSLGTVIRINPGFMLFRTNWNVGNMDKPGVVDTILQVSNNISSIYR